TAVAPGAAGLLALPALLGERAPYWDPVPRGTLLGLRREHRREHLVRALLDGVCLRLAMVRDAVVRAGSEVDAICATGGALRSPAWTASLTAALGSPVQLAEATGGSGLGAALLGWRALGAFDSLAAAAAVLPAGRTVVPDSDAVRRLAALRPLANRAHQALRDIAAELSGLVEQWEV
ncbi:MAG: FGGY-family carbohydrate kinase, partial [Pseudonocardiaceae bacterium]